VERHPNDLEVCFFSPGMVCVFGCGHPHTSGHERHVHLDRVVGMFSIFLFRGPRRGFFLFLGDGHTVRRRFVVSSSCGRSLLLVRVAGVCAGCLGLCREYSVATVQRKTKASRITRLREPGQYGVLHGKYARKTWKILETYATYRCKKLCGWIILRALKNDASPGTKALLKVSGV